MPLIVEEIDNKEPDVTEIIQFRIKKNIILVLNNTCIIHALMLSNDNHYSRQRYSTGCNKQ
jgi:hypothetical protein